jgi:hypothetical protein
LAEVDKQLAATCFGTASAVNTLQTNSGIKDAFTQPRIDMLIARARELQRCEPGHTPEDIQVELLKWVDEKKATILNLFLTLKGQCFLSLFWCATVWLILVMIDFDAARDTPIEILHTILLGIVKYAWYGSHSSWKDSDKKIYADHLQATNIHGLSVPTIRATYIMQYANSLIGRQLKTIAQVNTFHVHDLGNGLQFCLTKAIGELSALLWMPEIRNMKEYLVSPPAGD